MSRSVTEEEDRTSGREVEKGHAARLWRERGGVPDRGNMEQGDNSHVVGV